MSTFLATSKQVYASGARLLFLDDEQTLLQTVERPANPREIVAVQCCNADGRVCFSFFFG